MTSMFPLDPSVGDVYENYEWNGVAWKFIGYEKINDYAPKDSPAITGVASLPSQTTIGVVNKNEIEKLYGFSGQIASTQYVDSKIASTLAGLTGGSVTFVNPTIDTPAGTVLMFGGLAAPFGYLLCDGSSVSRTAYASLFAVIGTTYGSISGTTFNVPNLKGKVAVGLDATQADFDTIGETGGANTHQHIAGTSGNHDGHNHTIPAHGTNAGSINISIGGEGDHGHNITGHTHDTTDHSHSVNPGAVTSGASSSNNSVTLGSGFSHANSGHTHSVNPSSTTSSGASAGNTTGGASANVTSSNSGNHGHTANVSAFNTADTAGSHSHTVPASSTLSNLQPYIVLNYIIKT